MNYLKIDKASMVDGPGVRVVLWVAGCTVNCSGCHNPESHNFNAGQEFTDQVMEELCAAAALEYIQGLTLSGGNPVESPIMPIIETFKERFPQKDIWLYCGWELTMKDFGNSHHNLSMVDVIVDGPYIAEQRDITLPYRGSRNQRLIDVKKTLEQGEIVEWEK